MKKIFALFALGFVALVSCKKDNTTPAIPVATTIQKSWQASLVKENNTTVYTKGATNNTKPGYSSFRLVLGASNSVTLTEVDGASFSGQWVVSADEKTLTLNNLSPQPTGSAGTIAFTINSATDTELKITRTTPNPKTGNSTNEYTLIP